VERRRLSRNIPIRRNDTLIAIPISQTGTVAAQIRPLAAEDCGVGGTVVAVTARGLTIGLHETSTCLRSDVAAANVRMVHDGVRRPTMGAAAAQNSVRARIQ